MIYLGKNSLIHTRGWIHKYVKSFRTYLRGLFIQISESLSIAIVISSGGSRISPKRGHQLPGGAPTYKFAKFYCMKLKEFGPPGGHALPRVPLRSATDIRVYLEGYWTTPNRSIPTSSNWLHICSFQHVKSIHPREDHEITWLFFQHKKTAVI